ncbi:ferredoxin [Pseudonocardia xinjiangensis]
MACLRRRPRPRAQPPVRRRHSRDHRVRAADREGEGMRVVVDLNRCLSYGQCVFAAPPVFRWSGEESLEYDYAPDESLRGPVERAAAACPVQAISVGDAVPVRTGGDG